MAIIGFMALVVLMLFMTAAYLFAAANCMGRYNIGGVPNGWLGRLICLAAGAGLFYAWALLLSASPLQIVAA